jgi:hypothetical protein
MAVAELAEKFANGDSAAQFGRRLGDTVNRPS